MGTTESTIIDDPNYEPARSNDGPKRLPSSSVAVTLQGETNTTGSRNLKQVDRIHRNQQKNIQHERRQNGVLVQSKASHIESNRRKIIEQYKVKNSNDSNDAKIENNKPLPSIQSKTKNDSSMRLRLSKTTNNKISTAAASSSIDYDEDEDEDDNNSCNQQHNGKQNGVDDRSTTPSNSKPKKRNHRPGKQLLKERNQNITDVPAGKNTTRIHQNEAAFVTSIDNNHHYGQSSIVTVGTNIDDICRLKGLVVGGEHSGKETLMQILEGRAPGEHSSINEDFDDDDEDNNNKCHRSSNCDVIDNTTTMGSKQKSGRTIDIPYVSPSWASTCSRMNMMSKRDEQIQLSVTSCAIDTMVYNQREFTKRYTILSQNIVTGDRDKQEIVHDIQSDNNYHGDIIDFYVLLVNPMQLQQSTVRNSVEDLQQKAVTNSDDKNCQEKDCQENGCSPVSANDDDIIKETNNSHVDVASSQQAMSNHMTPLQLHIRNAVRTIVFRHFCSCSEPTLACKSFTESTMNEGSKMASSTDEASRNLVINEEAIALAAPSGNGNNCNAVIERPTNSININRTLSLCVLLNFRDLSSAFDDIESIEPTQAGCEVSSEKNQNASDGPLNIDNLHEYIRSFIEDECLQDFERNGWMTASDSHCKLVVQCYETSLLNFYNLQNLHNFIYDVYLERNLYSVQMMLHSIALEQSRHRLKADKAIISYEDYCNSFLDAPDDEAEQEYIDTDSSSSENSDEIKPDQPTQNISVINISRNQEKEDILENSNPNPRSTMSVLDKPIKHSSAISTNNFKVKVQLEELDAFFASDDESYVATSNKRDEIAVGPTTKQTHGCIDNKTYDSESGSSSIGDENDDSDEEFFYDGDGKRSKRRLPTAKITSVQGKKNQTKSVDSSSTKHSEENKNQAANVESKEEENSEGMKMNNRKGKEIDVVESIATLTHDSEIDNISDSHGNEFMASESVVDKHIESALVRTDDDDDFVVDNDTHVSKDDKESLVVLSDTAQISVERKFQVETTQDQSESSKSAIHLDCKAENNHAAKNISAVDIAIEEAKERAKQMLQERTKTVELEAEQNDIGNENEKITKEMKKIKKKKKKKSSTLEEKIGRKET